MAAAGSVSRRVLRRHPGLGVDHGDVVGEDVVQVVGDAHALRDHATLGLGLSLVRSAATAR
jgi:hypothetical protein